MHLNNSKRPPLSTQEGWISYRAEEPRLEYTRLGASLTSRKEDTESNPSTLRSAMMDSTQTPSAIDCLGRTCLKWTADGELTSLDLILVLNRLAQVDQEVTGLRTGSLDCQPCPSIN